MRSEGHKIPAEIVNIRKPDSIVFTYYEPDRFERYLKFEPSNMYYISKINRFEYRDNPGRILERVKSGEIISVVFLNSVSFFNENIVKANLDNPKIKNVYIADGDFDTVHHRLYYW